MAYLASALIQRAWNLAGIVAADFEVQDGSETEAGLFLFNELLSFMSCDLKKIPYFSRATLQLVQGQEEYFIPNLYQVETFTFNIGDVRFPTSYQNRSRYFGTGRVDDIQALPFSWHLERTVGGSNLFVYFLPQQNFVANITGKYALTNVDEFTDLSVYDPFYQVYLRYALAEKMCLEWDITFPEDKKRYLMTMGKKLELVSPVDLTLRKLTYITDEQPFDWRKLNISPAWSPG